LESREYIQSQQSGAHLENKGVQFKVLAFKILCFVYFVKSGARLDNREYISSLEVRSPPG